MMFLEGMGRFWKRGMCVLLLVFCISCSDSQQDELLPAERVPPPDSVSSEGLMDVTQVALSPPDTDVPSTAPQVKPDGSVVEGDDADIAVNIPSVPDGEISTDADAAIPPNEDAEVSSTVDCKSNEDCSDGLICE